MAAVLGFTGCAVLGCMRKRHVSPTGITYGRCLAHTLQLMSGAFGSGQDTRPVECPPASGSGVLPGVVNARPAA